MNGKQSSHFRLRSLCAHANNKMTRNKKVAVALQYDDVTEDLCLDLFISFYKYS